MSTVLRVLHLNVLLHLVFIEVLLCLCPAIDTTLRSRYLAHASRTTSTQTLNSLRTITTQNILYFVSMPLHSELSPHLENDWDDVLHAPTHKEQRTHRINQVIVLFKLSHQLVFR